MGPGQPDKTIVSKSKYVQVQFLRTAIGFIGVSMLLAAAYGAMLTIMMLLEFTKHPDWQQIDYGGIAFPRIFGECGGVVFMGFGVYKMCIMSVKTIARAKKMNHVVPLTKANAPYLPVQESLVRASEEPSVAPETVLLRAAPDNTTTLPKQLVRPSCTPEQT